MLPVVAIVGRPNVGKSTLFNRLTRTRQAVVSAYAGTTRDRQYGEVNLHHRHFIIIDTGGLSAQSCDIDKLMNQQALQAIQDADKIIFVIDGKANVTPDDHHIMKVLREKAQGKPIILVVNKTENMNAQTDLADAYELGFNPIIPIAAEHGAGVIPLLEALFPQIKDEDSHLPFDHGIKLAIVGRPNVGKSTLTNRMLGEERVIIHDSPGTTRDSIFVPLTRFGKQYTLIDTAGVRRRKNRTELLEKFSVVKTLQSIKESHVVLYIIDARFGVKEQDLKLLSFIIECGKGLVLAMNKWDGMDEESKQQAKTSIHQYLHFIHFARLHYISALHGTNVGNLFDSIDEAYLCANQKLSTPLLTRLLQKALVTHSPPLVHGRRIKLRFAHPGGNNPPLIIIHGNQVEALPQSYKQFLIHFFQKHLKLFGTPIHIQFKSSNNPFAKNKN